MRVELKKTDSSRKSLGNSDSIVTLSSPFSLGFARMQDVWVFGAICRCARPVRRAGSPTRTRFPDSVPDRPLSDYSVIRTLAWFGGEENGLRRTRDDTSRMVRPPHKVRTRPAQWQDEDLPGARGSTCGLPAVQRREARAIGLSSRQSLRHRALCFLRRQPKPSELDQGRRRVAV